MAALCHGVFAGGGVRGIGYVGAAMAAEQAGYTFQNLAGSSAGAVVAALLAAGYTSQELYREMLTANYLKFKQKGLLDRLDGPGKFLSILLNYGIYSANYFEKWLEELLARKGVRTFGDLPCVDGCDPCRLQVTVTDLLEKRVLVFPRDLAGFGLEPMEFPVAKAVRMSMSIPIFYEPYCLWDSGGRRHYMVDGGMVSNYPIWILDDGRSRGEVPVFGFRFTPSKKACDTPDCLSRITALAFFKALVSTMLDSYDSRVAQEDSGDCRRSIWIPTEIWVEGKQREVSSTDFGITREESEALFQNGYRVGRRFFETWNFEAWKSLYRSR